MSFTSHHQGGEGTLREAGGIALAEISLSLCSGVEELFEKLESRGAKGRIAAAEHLSGHLIGVLDRVCELALQESSAAQWAAQFLSVLSYRYINLLIEIGCAVGEGIGKDYAGRNLARVEMALEKHAERLRINSAYRETKERLGKVRRDMIAPGVIGRKVQVELVRAECCREMLLFHRRLPGVDGERPVPAWIAREFLASEGLPAFSRKSEPQWWLFLWPLLKKRIDVRQMRPLKQRDHKHGGIKDRKRYLADLQKAARDHLRSLSHLRDAGLF